MRDRVFRRRGLLAGTLLLASIGNAVVVGAVPSGASSNEVSTVGSPTTYQLMHDLFGSSLNDLLAGGTTADQKIDATAQLCKTGVTYDATSKAPNGSAAGKAALKEEETAPVTQRGCIDFVRSATSPGAGTPSTRFDYYAYALDAVAPLVGTAAGGSREQPPTLTLTDMKDIYKCKPGYTTWSSVTGGTPAPIVRFWPETGSDTRSIYADLLGFTPATTPKGTAGDTCTTKPITAFATVGGTGTHVTQADPESSEAGIVYQASIDRTTPVADAITVYSVGRFIDQWNTTARYNKTATNPISGTAIGNFSASTLLLAKMQNRTSPSATQPFADYGAQSGTFEATTNRGTFAVNTSVVKEANEWYSHMPHPTSPAGTSTAPVPGVHYVYNVADTALPTYDEAKVMIGFDNQATGTKSSLCNGDDSATILAAGFVPLNRGTTAPDPTSDKANAHCREFPGKAYPGFGGAKNWTDAPWVSTGGRAVPATYALRPGFPKEWDTYPWTSTITTVALGDLVVVYLHANTTKGRVKSVQDSNDRITWHSSASIAGTDSAHLGQRLEMWIGTVKSVGSTKITSTWTPPTTRDYFIYVWEFSSALGASVKWTVTASAFKTHGTTGPDTVTWPSLTSGPTGGIWVGTAYPGAASSDDTTTSGFTYVFDVHGNPLVERVTLGPTTAYAPKVKQTTHIRLYDAICLIVKAASPTP